VTASFANIKPALTEVAQDAFRYTAAASVRTAEMGVALGVGREIVPSLCHSKESALDLRRCGHPGGRKYSAAYCLYSAAVVIRR
jgi:hypothetical protein